MPGAAGTTHEVCLNAIVDVVGTRSKLGNVVSSWGLSLVSELNWVTTVVSCEGAVMVGSFVDLARSTEGGYDAIVESTVVCGSADASTLCGGVGSTNVAAEGVKAFATEIGIGNRYSPADVIVDVDAVSGTSSNVKM